MKYICEWMYRLVEELVFCHIYSQEVKLIHCFVHSLFEADKLEIYEHIGYSVHQRFVIWFREKQKRSVYFYVTIRKRFVGVFLTTKKKILALHIKMLRYPNLVCASFFRILKFTWSAIIFSDPSLISKVT